jgi:hypothetical protein
VLAARQIEAHMPGSSRIPKLNLPPPLIGLLKPGLTITTMATAPPTVLPTTSHITASASPATAVVLA